MSPTTRVLVALGAGLALGIAISSSNVVALQAIPGYVEPIGTAWVNALRMTVIPLVVSAILVGINSLPDPRSVGRMGARSLSYFLIMLAIAAAFAITAGPVVLARLTVDPATTLALRSAAARASVDAVQSAKTIAGFGDWAAALVPANPVKAAADGSILQLIVFTVFVGMAVTTIGGSNRESLMRVVRGIYESSLVLVRWVLVAAPVGVFGLTVPLATKLGAAAARAVVFYVLAVSAMTVAFNVVLYLAVWLVGKQDMRRFARACVPAQAVALSSRSSLASLPALLEGADIVLGVPSSIRSFVLPLAVATFRPAGAIGMSMGVLFCARLYGVHLGVPQLATVAFTAIVTTFSAPGIPGGSLFVMVPVLASVGVPVEGIGLLLGADTIPDIVRTITNVTGDMAGAAILARFEPVVPAR